MIDSTKYGIHPEAFKLMKEIINKNADDTTSLHFKAGLYGDRLFVHMFMYAKHIGTDKEHIEYLSKHLKLDTLGLTEFLGAIEKHQKELKA
jgi:hypothetical protein